MGDYREITGKDKIARDVNENKAWNKGLLSTPGLGVPNPDFTGQ